MILIRASMAVTRARTTIVSAVNTGSGVGINGKDTGGGVRLREWGKNNRLYE